MPLVALVLVLIVSGIIRNSRKIVNEYINEAIAEEKTEYYRRNH